MAVLTLERTQNNCHSESLISKVIFDKVNNVEPLNGKPSVVAEGFHGRKISDSVDAESKDGCLDTSILSDPPNLYKQTGGPMSKIPYLFETPVPKYFREKEWFKNENTWKFVTWAFAKCSNQSYTTVYDGCEITLQPYEFICGRNKSSAECFLTPKQFRGQLILLQNARILKKGANSKANRFTSYIWVVEHFSENEGQLNGRQRANSGPTSGHNLEDKKIRYKEKDHPSIPSFEKEGRDGSIDDSFSKKEEKIHVLLTCYLTKEELEECIKIRGSIEKVHDVVTQVANWPGRKYEIKDWMKTIKEWKLKNVVGDRIAQNEELGKKVEELYGESFGWKARVYRDNIKDIRGIIFEGTGAAWTPVFVPFTDQNFKEKITQTITEKRMKKKGEK